MRFITEVTPTKEYELILTFDNGEQRIVDIKPILSKGGVFTTLRDYNQFKRVKVNKDTGTVTWPDEIDLCPDTLYMNSMPFNKVI